MESESNSIESATVARKCGVENLFDSFYGCSCRPQTGWGIILLMPALVSLDIETTGLDPNLDSIIEIGAVKFTENRVESEFSTLVNPRKPISTFITNLTGISNSMVQNAPLLVDILPEAVDFIGDAAVLGHNVAFDLSFFQKVGALRSNPSIDTYELASVLMPTASRYGLSALGHQL
ncbi:MAG: 3'-5' exonuclease, partial [Anaerolineaceae bacterium]